MNFTITKFIKLTIAGMLLFSMPAIAIQQSPHMLSVDNCAAFAQKESDVLKARYHLNMKQYAAVQRIDSRFYLDLAKAFRDYRTHPEKKLEIMQLNAKREADLKGVFSHAQFAAFKKDVIARGIVVKHRTDSLNNLQRFRVVPGH
jgi:hypothetical protein